MVTLKNDQLLFEFDDIKSGSGVSIIFERTLRVPDNGQAFALPPGLGRFPLRNIENFDLGANNDRKERGGVIMPMFQTDAVWLRFNALNYERLVLPVALKIGAGKINAVSGEKWAEGLSQNPQNYVVVPGQPWLDGFNVAKGKVRQFVAMPLGQGYTVEEQIDSESDIGGIQIEAIPMKKAAYEALKEQLLEDFFIQNRGEGKAQKSGIMEMNMGLGMGGSIDQEIYDDEYGLDAWDIQNSQRCFVMLANAEQWIAITGERPPLSPISAAEYSAAGLPWFDYFDGDKEAIEGAEALGQIKSVKEIAQEKRDSVWPKDEESFDYTVKPIKPSDIFNGSW